MRRDEYICDDRPKPTPQAIIEMTDEEIEAEYQKIFWRVVNKQ